jgi:hypothetical protein
MATNYGERIRSYDMGSSLGRQLTGTLFFRILEESEVSLIWSAAAMPEKEPLHELVLLKLILETEAMILVEP